jgi:hypothetical protein
VFFILLTFASALLLEGLGSALSVIGITKLFGFSPLIIALAIALDLGKVTAVSLLYSYYKQLSFLMKSYAFVAATVTMIITSAGASGYLSGKFQEAIIGTKEGEQKVQVLKEQQARYQERKKQIDDQIAKLPERTTVNQRLRLMNGFKVEQKTLDDKIASIDKELPDLQLKQIGTEAKAGPILYVAKAFDISVEQAVKYVILLIIFVFDPLAIFLIIAGNFLWAQRRISKLTPELESLPTKEPSPEENSMFDIDKSWPQSSQEQGAFDPAYDARGHERWQPSYEPIYTELQPTPQQGDPLPPVTGTWSEDFTFHAAEPLKVPELEPEVQELEGLLTEERRYVPSGVLSPIDVSTEHVPDAHQSDEFPTELKREEITRSSLGLIEPDPRTIVDARRVDKDPGRAKTLKSLPSKDRGSV